MRIAVIGSGNIGETVGRLWGAANHTVVFTSRHPDAAAKLAEEIGPNAHTADMRRAVEDCEVVLLAAPLKALGETLAPMADRFSGKFVIDAMNPFPQRDGDIAERALGKRAAVLLTTEHLPYARVTRAFSNIYYETLRSEAHREGRRLAVPFAGNDPDAKEIVEGLIRDAGFDPYDLGSLQDSKPLDPDGALFKTSYTVKDLEKVLAGAS
jgi:hypothetical protein